LFASQYVLNQKLTAMKTIMPLLFCLLTAWVSHAQTYTATDYIRSLKEGTLIVKLPTHTAKLKAMKKLANDETVSPNKRDRLKMLIENTEKEALAFQRNMVLAFDSVYTFSEVLFTFDQQYDQLKAGKLDGIFLDDDLQINPNIKATQLPFFVLRFGSTNREGSYGVEAMVIMNDQLKDMQSPFPYYQKTADLRAVVGRLLPAENQDQRDAIRQVKRLNKKLFNYYKSVGRE
jgi:hypothetical protein